MDVNHDLKVYKNGQMFTCIRDYYFNSITTSEAIAKLLKLFDEGADINAQDGNDNNNTILHISARKGEKEMIDFLLQKGAKLGDSPLDVALEHDKKEAVSIFSALPSKIVEQPKIQQKNDKVLVQTNVKKEKLNENNNKKENTKANKNQKANNLARSVSVSILSALPSEIVEQPKIQEKNDNVLVQTNVKKEKTNENNNKKENTKANKNQKANNLARSVSHQPVANSDDEMYEKRGGTSGASGQFYESKLLSLVLHGGLQNKLILNFVLATNIRDVGDFDDVCVRIETNENGIIKHDLCFMQAKHKEDVNKSKLSVASLRNPTGPFAITKYYDSFIKIIQKISPNAKHKMFKGDMAQLNLHFILYTPLKDGFHRKLKNGASVSPIIDSLIYTGDIKTKKDDIFQFDYEDEDIDLLTKYLQQENLKKIGKVFLDFIKPDENRPKEMMNSDLIKLYHPAIAREVVIIFDEIYEGKFKEEFFSTNNEILVELREFLYIELVFQRDVKTELTKEEIQRKIKKILQEPTAMNISQLIGEVLDVNKENKKLQINANKLKLNQFQQEELSKIDNDLNNLDVSLDVINEAIRSKGKKKLRTITFNLPIGFGNQSSQSKSLHTDVIKDLSKVLFNFVMSSDSVAKSMFDNNYLLKRYHAALTDNVIEVYKFYKGKFRDEFLDSDKEHLITLRDSLVNEIVLNQSKKTALSKEVIKQKLKDIVKNPRAKTISTLMGEILSIDKDSQKLKLDVTKISITQYSQDELRQLNNDILKVHVSPTIIKTAIDIVGKEKLSTLVFKLPQTFGNFDIQTTMQKRDDNTARLDFFAEKFSDLIKKNKSDSKILVINTDVVGPQKLFELSHINNIGNIGGAVGNLLLYDKETHMYVFNTAEETPIEGTSDNSNNLQQIGNNAKYMRQKIKELSKTDLGDFKIKVDLPVCYLPRTSFEIIEYDKKLAREFLGQLWFYTNQANEENVEEKLKIAIDEQYRQENQKNQYLFRVYSDAIFLRFHDEVQKWWKLQGKATYLTKKTKLFEDAKKGIVESPLLTVLNQMFVRSAKNIDVEFNTINIKPSKVIDILQKTTKNNYKILNIISNATILSAIKLLQFTERNNTNDIRFINLDYVNILPQSEYNTMREEIEKMISTTLIIFSETQIEEHTHLKLQNMLEVFKGNLIIISDNALYLGSKFLHFEYTVQNDNEINLNNLTPKSQTDVLNKYKIFYQGEQVILNTIIEDQLKHIINGKLLWIILNNAKLEVGHPLVPAYNYDLIKNNFINRSLYRDSEEVEVNTFNDIDEKNAVISSKPCGGKTILFTHLAFNTKLADPQLWIVQINMSSHIKEFSKFENKTLNNMDIFMFLCKNALKNVELMINVEFSEENEKVCIVNAIDHKYDLLFELKLFVRMYNNGRILFLFDGFERMYPQNTQNALNFFKVLRQADKRFYITSSCYCNNILKTEFEALYELPRLNINEQRSFLDRFWETNLKLENLNHEQFDNILVFFNFIRRSFNLDIEEFDQDRPISTLLSIPMQLIYISASEHFKNEIENLTPKYLRDHIKKKWRLDSYTAMDRFLGRSHDEESLELAGTPMHMYLAASHFEVQIKEKIDFDFKGDEFCRKAEKMLDIFKSYERTLKNNLKELSSIDVKNMDEKKIDREQSALRDKFLETHKNLALFSLCKESDIAKILTPAKIKEVKKLIKELETGEFKSPLIDCVIDGVPSFYHLIMAEYFIVEFGASTLKMAANRYQSPDELMVESIWDFIVNVILLLSPDGVRNAFEYKLKFDPELQHLTNNERSGKIIFDLIKKQKEDRQNTEDGETSLDLAINKGLVHTTNFLLKAVQAHVDRDNIDICMSVVKTSTYLVGAVKPDWKGTTDTILKFIKGVNGVELIDFVNSNKLEELVPIASDLCMNTDFGQKMMDNIKTNFCGRVKKLTEVLATTSGQNENLVTLVDELSDNLPEVVDHVAFLLSHFK